MSRVRIIIALALLFLVVPVIYAQPGEAMSQVTLNQAIQKALERNPKLEARRAEVAEAAGRLVGARQFPFNPVLELETAQSLASTSTGSALTVGIAQELEVAGQRGSRIEAAKAALMAIEKQFQQEQRLMVADVSLAFYEALRAREILEISRQDKDLAELLLGAAQRKLEAGSTSQLELNLAMAELGRAEEQFYLNEGAYGEARAVLAEVVALEPGSPPSPMGSISEETPASLPPLPELLQSAPTHRSDLEALRLTEQAVQARLKLARREAIPNLAIGAYVGREGGGEAIIGGGVGVALPVLNRNEGAIVEARATVQKVAAEKKMLQLQIEREVSAAWFRYQAATRSEIRLRETVLGTLEENLELLRKAYEAGKISSTEVLVIRRAFFEGRRELVEAAIMARRARVILEMASGRLIPPETIQDGQR